MEDGYRNFSWFSLFPRRGTSFIVFSPASHMAGQQPLRVIMATLILDTTLAFLVGG